MANLSQDDCFVILKHSFDDCLNHLWDLLQKVEQSFELSLTSDNGAGKTRD